MHCKSSVIFLCISWHQAGVIKADYYNITHILFHPFFCQHVISHSNFYDFSGSSTPIQCNTCAAIGGKLFLRCWCNLQIKCFCIYPWCMLVYFSLLSLLWFFIHVVTHSHTLQIAASNDHFDAILKNELSNLSKPAPCQYKEVLSNGSGCSHLPLNNISLRITVSCFQG